MLGQDHISESAGAKLTQLRVAWNCPFWHVGSPLTEFVAAVCSAGPDEIFLAVAAAKASSSIVMSGTLDTGIKYRPPAALAAIHYHRHMPTCALPIAVGIPAAT